MFEKEAEKYTSNLDECRTKDLMRDSFKDGAEFVYNEQLTKAKEIIKKFLEFVNNEDEFDSEHPQEHTDLWNELCEKAEQFISEVENDKEIIKRTVVENFSCSNCKEIGLFAECQKREKSCEQIVSELFDKVMEQ